MASQASQALQPSPVCPTVTLKVNYGGVTRRFKLELRDMSAATFEDKLRQSLDIPLNARCKIERWSDSANGFILLDRNNPSVYKQLYRAAKAKLKLKIRITNVEVPKQTRSPPAVTVEDVQEETTPATDASEQQTENMAKKTVQSNVLERQLAEPLHIMPLRPRAKAPTVAVDTQAQATTAESAKERPTPPRSQLPTAAKAVGPSQPQLPGNQDLLSGPDEPQGFSARKPVISSNLPGILGYGDFRVCCNSCEETIPNDHYHCTKCDDDDFDLCQSCVDRGITCYSPDHWLIKRFKKDGIFVSSTTETLPPKLKVQKESLPSELSRLEKAVASEPPPIPYARHRNPPPYRVRACNSCVQERPEHQFVHCTACEDYDLCMSCFSKDAHGHHPKHSFELAVADVQILSHVAAKLAPGRNHSHNAICDQCDKFIRGVRHKCLDCPDWDYCGDCVKLAPTEHAGHRFAPIYESLSEPPRFMHRTVHQGICCDGPLCASDHNAAYITGVRYKCAVCPDTDFCGSCEAHPSNTHNKTHPLIKFKTAVRHALVSTSGFDGDGSAMPQMGDVHDHDQEAVARAPKPTMSSPRPVFSVEPSEPVVIKQENLDMARLKHMREDLENNMRENLERVRGLCDMAKLDQVPEQRAKKSPSADLRGLFVKDTVTDGTVLTRDHVFEQTWILRNSGKTAWPAGCAVKFVGGDYMGHVDSKHPAGISELVSASESTVCYEALEPGKEYPFTVLLRTPPRDGRVISYWRLTTPEGVRFGHRLWCDVIVQGPEAAKSVEVPVKALEESAKALQESAKALEESAKEIEESTKVVEKSAKATEDGEVTVSDNAVESSQMVFPKLEKESPVASIHEAKEVEETEEVAPDSPLKEAESVEDFEEWNRDGEEWDGSDEGFLTDEEYDILDASDQEWDEPENSKATLKK